MKVESLFKIYANHFGEPPLFLTESTSLTPKLDSELLCISKHNFLKLIKNATISIKIIQILSQCLHYKAVMAAEISTQDLSINDLII
jgi:CRP-like cAMP-binding protein